MPAGQQFPVPCSLIDEIASPAGHIYSQSEQKFVKNRDNRPRVRPQERPPAIPTAPSTCQIGGFLPSLGRGRVRLGFALLSLLDFIILIGYAAVHRRKGLFERSLPVQILEAAQTEGFEEEWRGAP